jgi:hypothetical protein
VQLICARSAAAVACLLFGYVAAGFSRTSAARLKPGATYDFPAARTLLQEVAGFTAADWNTIEAGRAVARILETDNREIAVVGAVRIAAPRDLFVARVRDVEALKRSAVVLDVGRFGHPPQVKDLLTANIDDYNLDLKACKPGDCRVRLTAADIGRFHQEIDWRAADWRRRSASIWREVLAGHAASYVQAGRPGLPVYANKRESLSVPSELTLLLGKFGFVARYSSEFHAYLQNFGPQCPAGAEDTLYWTKEDFGIRPVFRISHQVIYQVTGSPSSVLVATNQVYADHYLDAALGIMLALDAPPDSGGGRGFHMIAVNRARTRSLGGTLRGLVRGTVQNRSRDAMQKILTATKSALERASSR